MDVLLPHRFCLCIYIFIFYLSLYFLNLREKINKTTKYNNTNASHKQRGDSGDKKKKRRERGKRSPLSMDQPIRAPSSTLY